MTRAAIFASGSAGRLGDEGHRARGARVDLEHVDDAALNRELHVHEADDVELEGELTRLLAQLVLRLARERVRRQEQRRVPRVHARLLDVLHDAADEHVLAVGDASTSTSMASLRKRSSSTGLSFGHLHRMLM